LTIIGFSQGGYLAPLLGLDIPETKLVIGIGCEFRSLLISEMPKFQLEAIHGDQDQAISPAGAYKEIERLKERGISCGWHLIPGAAHAITPEMGPIIKNLMEAHGKRSL